MMNAKTKLRSRLVLALVAAGLMATPALAKVVKGTQDVLLSAVSSSCSPCDYDGTTVCAKVYKDTCTGIICLAAKGSVANKCGCQVSFQNRGICLIDPCTGTEYTSTSDCETVSRPKPCRCACNSCSNSAAAVLVACYVPSCNCAPTVN